jgi:hypothetical protein
MTNLKALETYFNDSITIAQRNNPRAIPVIYELKSISLAHAAGNLTELQAQQRMHAALARHGHNPSILDECFFEAKNIKAAAFDPREFQPRNNSYSTHQVKQKVSPFASMFQGVGANFNKRVTATVLGEVKGNARINSFKMPSFEEKRSTQPRRPQHTGFKMADFGKGFVIGSFESKPAKKEKQGMRTFSMPSFKIGGK